jgi:hypothetical protein
MSVQSQTGVVDYNDPLVRKSWMKKGMIQDAHKSVWSGMIGTSDRAVIYQKSNFTADEGHTVTFDWTGNLSSRSKRGKERAYGNSEQKRKFSDSLTIERHRWSVDNGDKFDSKNIGDLSLSEHAQSRVMLNDLYMRGRDQGIFDMFQGVLHDESPTHIIRAGAKASIGDLTSTEVMSYEFLKRIEAILTTSIGYTVGDKRRPPDPYYTADGEAVWFMGIDAFQYEQLITDDTFVTIMANADIRGEGNRLIKGAIAKVGQLVIVKLPNFYGETDDRDLGQSEVEIAGMRQFHENDSVSGEADFDEAGVYASRAIILGRMAGELGYGMPADYRFQLSDDFGITSESAIEVWMNMQKTRLRAANTDYKQAKVADTDYSCIVVETYAGTNA